MPPLSEPRREDALQLAMGNEAVAEAAIRAGCRAYFGYPITPQSELLEYMARRLPEAGGIFLQAESEVAAINMVYGAAGAGARVMTSSSGPGISLMAEGISFLAGAELPCVIVNMSRGGPGLGGIAPAQSDYFLATRGPGHGDHRLLVYAPASVQEAADLTADAFSVADRYRNPVMLLGCGLLGQMMEPVRFPDPVDPDALPPKPWATTGRNGRPERNVINSLRLDPEDLWGFNQRLRAKYARMEADEVRWEAHQGEDADLGVVAYGVMARICRTAAALARQEGIRVGVLRPITLWPFPAGAVAAMAARVRAILTVEMSLGQLVEDVRLAVEGRCPVHFFGKAGGVVPTPREVLDRLRELAAGVSRRVVRPAATLGAV